MRQQKTKALAEISQKNLQFEIKISSDINDKNTMREQMTELERMMREVEQQIAQTNLENSALRQLLEGESELRQDRDNEEAHAMQAVGDDLKQNVQTVDEDKRKIRKQREFAETSINNFEKTIGDSK